MRLLRSILPLLPLAAALPAAAEDLSDLAGLLNEPVVTTASKEAETAGLAPAMTSVFTADDLRRHGFDSLHDAINFLAMGMLTEPAYATPEIGARGVLLTGDYGNHVLLLLDGHAVNEPWDGTAYYDWTAAIPLDVVDHVEVILGPGSVLYGSSAMLGVINVITKRARDWAGLHLEGEGAFPVGGRASVGYGAPLALGDRAGGVTVALEYVQQRGPRLSYERQPYDGVDWGGDATHRRLDVPSGFARLVLGDLDVGVRAALSRRAATQILGDFDDPDNVERDRWLSADARWGARLPGALRLGARVYGDLYDYFAHQPWTAAVDCLEGQDRCAYRANGASRWFGGELSLSRDWLGDGRLVTLLGAEGRRVQVRSTVDYRDLDTGADTRASGFTRGSTIAAAYLQQTLHLRRFSANAGVRFDHDPALGSHLSPRAALVVPAWRGGTVKAIYSEAFRAPSFYERFYSDPTEQLQAEDLRPETVRSLEAIVEQRLGAQRFRLGGFRTWWRDLVLTVPATDAQVAEAIDDGRLIPGATGVYLYANASRVESWGVNADWEGTGHGQRLRYGASITAARARAVDESGEAKLPAAAQLFGNARVSYDLGGRLPTLALAVRAVASRPVAGTDYDPPPTAPGVVQARVAVSGPAGHGLSYRLALDWASADRTAYAVGPDRSPENGLGRQPLQPMATFRAMAGLRWDR
ncbi:MAG TPA: TonB-dependent receptor [Anaeromyxobacter sp.]|nr:TonB-dependent receptor [Anaeromyxobacter sp.]